MLQWFPYLSQGVAASGHVGGVHGTHGVMLVALAVMWGVKTGRERERTRPSKDERCKCAEMQACDVVILLTLLMREKWKAYNLLEYQRDIRRCRFDTREKMDHAHRAGGPTL